MEEIKNEKEYIDLRVLAKKLWSKKKLYIITLPIVAIVAFLLILGAPRYYTSETSMAPEVANSTGGMGALGSIASSFGIDLSQTETTDAISPLLYPDLMEDNKFVVDLFSIKIKTSDGEISTTYYDYLKTKQKFAWWTLPSKWIGKWMRSLTQSKNKKSSKGKLDPYYLSEADDAIVNKIRNNIGIDVDRKTAIITVSTKSQDALVSKILADSIRQRLQQYITLYRTNKAQADVNYYKRLTVEAKQEYEKVRRSYGYYADANTDVILESVKAKQEDLENDMQLKYNTYSALNTQLQAARAKLQEKTPVFTVIKGAAVPQKPAGPKRMLFAIGMAFLAAIIITIYILKDEFIKK